MWNSDRHLSVSRKHRIPPRLAALHEMAAISFRTARGETISRYGVPGTYVVDVLETRGCPSIPPKRPDKTNCSAAISYRCTGATGLGTVPYFCSLSEGVRSFWSSVSLALPENHGFREGFIQRFSYPTRIWPDFHGGI